MANIKCSTTDRNGQVFLLVTLGHGDWAIKNASTGLFKVYGDEKYVKQNWESFRANEKRAIASNYDALARFSIRQTV